jgi:dGTPase
MLSWQRAPEITIRENPLMTMDWQLLASTKRLGRESTPSPSDPRSEYLRDWDRIVYSSAFRRMQDKTQVFPLAESDYVRTRLTHSIEVSSVGRSLGTLCGEFILANVRELSMVAQDFGSIVAAACLAHDIGNPPFGHSGEDAIQSWFALHGQDYLVELSDSEKFDLLNFEGNAQGFRLITRLQSSINRGGFQLTYAVLATYSKYPRGSIISSSTAGYVSEKKFGYCSQDAENFKAIANGTGLISKSDGAYVRHPLAFLMEAADDICYGIVDLEDGHRLGRVTFTEAHDLLWPIAFPHGQKPSESYTWIDDDAGKIEYLRARAIGNLIRATVEVFKEKYTEIMLGRFESDLVGQCKFSSALEKILALSRSKIYTTPTVLQIESAGFEILGGLLGKFVPALLTPTKARSKAHKKLVQIVPKQFATEGAVYDKLLGVTDYISGMTDSFALTLFRRLNGIELPGNSI